MIRNKRFLAALLCLLLTVCLAVPAAAADGDCTLVIRYFQGEEPLEGAEFSLYRVADFTDDGTMTLSGSFAEYRVDTSAGMTDLALTLYAMAAANGVQPDRQVTVDRSGSAVAEGLERGVYLVVGSRFEAFGKIFVSEPQLVYLPWRATSADPWDNEIVMLPKASELPAGDRTLKVLKEWADKGCEDYRPEDIEVTLLQDGQVYETVTLNAQNNWRYTWETLDERYYWSVAESVPEKYAVTVRREGVTYVITNTCEEPPPPPTEPPPDIPQTGVLWWPVPVMAGVGLVLLVVGSIGRKEEKDEA